MVFAFAGDSTITRFFAISCYFQLPIADCRLPIADWLRKSWIVDYATQLVTLSQTFCHHQSHITLQNSTTVKGPIGNRHLAIGNLFTSCAQSIFPAMPGS